MTDDLMDKLFEQARNQTTETKVEEVSSWVSAAAVSTIGTVGVLSLLKLKLLTKKGIMYLGSIVLGVGIGVATIFNLQGENHEENGVTSKLEVNSNENIESITLLSDSLDEIKMEKIEKNNNTRKDFIDLENPPAGKAYSSVDQLPFERVIPTFYPPTPSIVKKNFVRKGVESQERIVDSFSKINVSSAIDVELSQGKSHSVRIEAGTDVIDNISTETINGKLIIKLEKTKKSINQKIKAYVTVVDINEIELTGAVNLKTIGEIKSDNLKTILTGATKVEFNFNCTDLQLVCSGASDINLKGLTEVFKIQTSGATKAICSDFKAVDVEIKSSGACELTCYAAESLKVNASGASDIKYSGSPKETKFNSSGASSIKKQ